MKVLYITNKPVYPTIDGGCLAMKSFLDCLLHADIEVKHLTLYTNKHPFNKEDYPQDIQDKVKPEGYYVKTDVTPFKALQAYFAKETSYNISRFYSPVFSEKIQRELNANTYDLIIFDSLFSSVYLKDIRPKFNGQIIVRTHNVESDIWKCLSENSTGLKKRYLQKLAADLLAYEVEILNAVDGIIALTQTDLQRFETMGIKGNKIVIPVTMSTTELSHKETGHVNYFHLGAMNWLPNIEAVRKLMELFPKIRKEVPASELHIAGAHISHEFMENKEEHIFIDGFVDDLNDYLSGMDVLISPIQSGSGVRIKLLETMAKGIPCITTSLGALGIDYKNHECLLVADDDSTLVEMAAEIGNDEQLRRKIGENARRYIQEYHNIEKVSNDLREFIQSK